MLGAPRVREGTRELFSVGTSIKIYPSLIHHSLRPFIGWKAPVPVIPVTARDAVLMMGA